MENDCLGVSGKLMSEVMKPLVMIRVFLLHSGVVEDREFNALWE